MKTQDRFDACIWESNWSIDDVLKTNKCYFLLPWNKKSVLMKKEKYNARYKFTTINFLKILLRDIHAK